MRDRNFADEAVRELERADYWADKERVELDTRDRMISHHTQRALVLSILAVAQEIQLVPSNIDFEIIKV